MVDRDGPYLVKARESLACVMDEMVSRRYNNVANRSYYAAFQAAIHALARANIQPPGTRGQWGHDFVQATFVAQLIDRRKLYPSDLRDALMRLFALRRAADYDREMVSERQADRARRRAAEMVDAVVARERSEP